MPSRSEANQPIGHTGKHANPKSIAAADAIIDLCKKLDPALRITYNKYHIALGTHRQNFCWLHPRKKQIHCHGDVDVGENTEKGKAILEQAGLAFTVREQGDLAFTLSTKDIEDKQEALKQVFRLAIDENS